MRMLEREREINKVSCEIAMWVSEDDITLFGPFLRCSRQGREK